MDETCREAKGSVVVCLLFHCWVSIVSGFTSATKGPFTDQDALWWSGSFIYFVVLAWKIQLTPHPSSFFHNSWLTVATFSWKTTSSRCNQFHQVCLNVRCDFFFWRIYELEITTAADMKTHQQIFHPSIHPWLHPFQERNKRSHADRTRYVRFICLLCHISCSCISKSH